MNQHNVDIEAIKARLEYLRGEIQAERISINELAELEDLAEYIESGDTLLLEWAGVPENAADTCKGCGSTGFAPRVLTGRCEFCDGTEGGCGPKRDGRLQTYSVTVQRTSTRTHTFTVEASNTADMRDTALEMANDRNFSKDAEDYADVEILEFETLAEDISDD